MSKRTIYKVYCHTHEKNESKHFCLICKKPACEKCYEDNNGNCSYCDPRLNLIEDNLEIELGFRMKDRYGYMPTRQYISPYDLDLENKRIDTNMNGYDFDFEGMNGWYFESDNHCNFRVGDDCYIKNHGYWTVKMGTNFKFFDNRNQKEYTFNDNSFYIYQECGNFREIKNKTDALLCCRDDDDFIREKCLEIMKGKIKL